MRKKMAVRIQQLPETIRRLKKISNFDKMVIFTAKSILKHFKMKKIALFAVLLLGITSAFAQKGKVTAADSYLTTSDLEKAKEAIDEALASEKSNTWPKTYITAAKVYSELYKNGSDDQGVIKAYNFYKKAIELDEKGNDKGKQQGKYKKDITFALTFFTSELTNSAIDCFNKNDYKGALQAFEAVLDLNASPLLLGEEGTASVDTAIVYNCALASYNAEDWDRAEKYFNQAIDLKYGGGDAVLLLNQVFSSTGDSTKMGANLQKGFEMYPDDERILTNLIQYYLATKQNDAALNYLNTAIEKDPENASFYYARGVLYESIDKEKAIENYEKSLEINPDFFNSLFNLGVIYYNKGVEQQNLANDITDFKKFKEAEEIAEEFWETALPYMEKAMEIQPDNKDVLESLKGLYYRFDRMDKYNEVKAKLESMN
jgi:tetratricopeptide (TPR) repeat protein